MYRYIDADQSLIGTSSGAMIPNDPLNGDYRDFLAWVEAGNEPTPFVVDLAAEKVSLARRVDEDAEAVRLRYITPGAGMAMVYQEKFAQAQAVAAMGEAAANAMNKADREADFPTLSASVGLEAATLYECAQLVLTKYAQFAALSLHIERARLSGKAAIKAASDVSGVRAAYGALTWPTP